MVQFHVHCFLDGLMLVAIEGKETDLLNSVNKVHDQAGGPCRWFGGKGLGEVKKKKKLQSFLLAKFLASQENKSIG